jgi:hypothetical protein
MSVLPFNMIHSGRCTNARPCDACARVARVLDAGDRKLKTHEFQHRGGFWPMNVTLEDERCGYDPREHRGRGMYKRDGWA